MTSSPSARRRILLPTIAPRAAQILGALFLACFETIRSWNDVVAPHYGVNRGVEVMQQVLKRKYWTMLAAAGVAVSCGTMAAYDAGCTPRAAENSEFLSFDR